MVPESLVLTVPDRCAEVSEPGRKEFFSSWALFIMIVLLIFALFTSYILQQRKIQAVHETVLSIFAGGFDRCSPSYPRELDPDGTWSHSTGMFVGLIIRLSPDSPIQDSVAFDYQFFFNLLLPPIILASGYELHQVGRAPGI